jgi:hypothetical protein
MTAGQPIIQSSTVTPGHVGVWTTDGVLQDGGPATEGALTAVGITANGGISFAISSANPPNPYVQYGVGVQSDGTITQYFESYGGAPGAALVLNINGTDYAFPGSYVPSSVITQVPNISTLRASTTASLPNSSVYVLGYISGADGGEGPFVYVSTDTTSADNGGTIIVDASGRRWYRETGGQPYSVKWFGAKGDDSTDDTAAFQATANALSLGGTFAAPDGYTFYLNGTLTLPVGVSLKGPYSNIGAPGNNSSAPYGSLSSIRLGTSGGITMSGGSVLDGCLIIPQGMTFPQSSSSAWTGTAITVAGDDATVMNSMIMGFALGVTSNGFQRLRVNSCNMDNVAGIFLTNSLDTPILFQVHMWPFATIASTAPATRLLRSGTAFSFVSNDDNGMVTNCFAFGYEVGFNISSCQSMTFTACGADNFSSPPVQPLGFSVTGASQDTNFIGCQASAMYIGFFITETTNTNVQTRLSDCAIWACTQHGIDIDAGAFGDVSISGGILRDNAIGVTVNSATPRVFLSNVDFYNNANQINLLVTSATVYIDADCTFGALPPGNAPVNSNLICPTIASAAGLNLLPNDNFFNISGTATIAAINGGWARRTVTLFFEASLTVTNSTGATGDIRLAGGTNFSAVTGSTLVLTHNGSQWFQVGGAA